MNLIKSALARPLQSAFGDDAYGDVFGKAAALLYSIANNHGFKDGDKRTAMAAAIYYLSLLGVDIKISNEEYEQFMLHVVKDRPEIKEIKSWLMQHSAESRLR